MTIINFFGDFKIDNPESLRRSKQLSSLMESSDYNVINFEAPVKKVDSIPIEKSGPNIFQDKKSPSWIENNGFNVVSLANNHICDMGIENAIKTKRSFKTASCIGVGSWEEAYGVTKLQTKSGLVIGILACTHYEFGVLADASIDTYGAAWANHRRFRQAIADARNEVDILIVFAHGGIEYMDHPLPEWRDVYKEFIDLGADAVIASHPHVPQGWEYYRKKPIFYSLGNFCFNLSGHERDYWYNSLCCSLIIDNNKNITVDVTPLKYDPQNNYIDTNLEDIDFKSHIDTLNYVIRHEDEYYKYVNDYVLYLLHQYIGQFARSGYLYHKGFLSFIKGGLDFIKGRKIYNKAHIINCIRCESHRWAFLRAYRLLYLDKK